MVQLDKNIEMDMLLSAFHKRDEFYQTTEPVIYLNSQHEEQKLAIVMGSLSRLKHQIQLASQQIFIIVGEGARVTFHIKDATSIESLSVQYHIFLEKSSQLDLLLSIIDASFLSVIINIYLYGAESRAKISGVYALGNCQNISIKTLQHHNGFAATSVLTMKGILKDSAQANYEGLIFIGENGKKTVASQENKNILLSAHAKVVSIPSIEVLQHDVQCFHGSAIAKFDGEQMWYLMGRGLEPAAAKNLLVQSFFSEVLCGFEDKETLLERVCQKII